MHSAIIVDDESLIKQSLSKLLLDSGLFNVVGEAVNGLEAITLVEELSPDLIITDIRMPVMSGLIFIEEVVKLHTKVEIIIISGYDDFEYAQQAISLGVSEYILKPVKPAKFMETIERVHKKCNSLDTKIKMQLEQMRLCRTWAISIINYIWTLNEAGIKVKLGEIKDFCDFIQQEYVFCREVFMTLASFLDEEWIKKTNRKTSTDNFLRLVFTQCIDKNMDILWEYIKKMMDNYKNKHNWGMGQIVKCSTEYIKCNCFNEELSLQTVAEHVGISAAYLSKAFIDEYGVNFVRYLTDIRIDKAKSLLGINNIKVYEVANKVGYCEYAHFARVFRKYTGLTPSEYRQRMLSITENSDT